MSYFVICCSETLVRGIMWLRVSSALRASKRSSSHAASYRSNYPILGNVNFQYNTANEKSACDVIDELCEPNKPELLADSFGCSSQCISPITSLIRLSRVQASLEFLCVANEVRLPELFLGPNVEKT